MPVSRFLHRFSWVGRPDPAQFGRDRKHRFDAPDGGYGVCYLGTSFDACFVEVILPAREPRGLNRFVTMHKLNSYYAAEATLLRPLVLAWFVGDAMVRMGLDARVTGGDDCELSRMWSAAVHRRRATASGAPIDGILYPTRHHNGLYSVALFERAASAVSFQSLGILGDPSAGRVWTETMAACRRYHLDVIT